MSPQTSNIDFDLRHLEIFQAVVDLKSFSRAAARVFLAQASVSERIATLEGLVGTRLLDRLGKQVVPTKAGELLYKHAVLLLDMKRTACLEMNDFLGVRKGEVSLGGSTIPGEYILPKLIGRFRQQYPFVSINLSIANTNEIKKTVLTGDLELGVVGSSNTHKNLIFRELWKDQLLLVVPSSHRWAGKKEVTVQDLIGEPFILRELGSGTLKILDNYLKSAGLKGIDALNTVARFGTSTAVKEGVKAGLGVSILSVRAADTELEMGILKALHVKDLQMNRNFTLITDRRRIASPLCRALVDFLLKSLEEEQKK
jgi:DNA-binding transcriptional LysR family regulator